MGTFTIDLLTGTQYLFNGDFVDSGGTPTVNWGAVTQKPQWLSGTTLNAFQTGHTHSYNNLKNKLSGGTGITIDSNIINAIAPLTTLQLIDIVGGININTIPATAINWTGIEFSGSSLSFTGGSKIRILSDGVYQIRYVLNFLSQSGGTKNVGAVVRKNNNAYITPSTNIAFSISAPFASGTNTMPSYETNLQMGDYIELISYRIGNEGSVLTTPNASWITVLKER